ncbi:hypothetical protein QL285_002352 [Trifolium repens]|nr:hypothetical protein QL285_002352 [Trifolium repens]
MIPVNELMINLTNRITVRRIQIPTPYVSHCKITFTNKRQRLLHQSFLSSKGTPAPAPPTPPPTSHPNFLVSTTDTSLSLVLYHNMLVLNRIYEWLVPCSEIQ